MKPVLFCFTLITALACNGPAKQVDVDTPTTQEKTETGTKGNGEMKDGISDYTNNKESFMLTCHIDASNALGGENTKQVDQFCACAWEKTKGMYPGSVVANDSKLEKDPTLKGCYEEAKKE